MASDELAFQPADDSAPNISSAKTGEDISIAKGDLDCKEEEYSIDLGERYRVLCKLGQGASAAVYKVQDKSLDKAFAIKIMRPELVADDYAQKRFTQEAELASSLTHANLVAVYGHGFTGDRSPYMVMDCLDGQTLAQLLAAEKQLDTNRVTDISIQVCDALIHMHYKGIIHRDIKPSNIFLRNNENGTESIKLVDFGIAKVQMNEDCTRLTQTGELLGSPLYMSPEQCKGEKLDCRSDIYSFGCVLYEMLTGVSPFSANNPVKTILKHVNGTVLPLNVAAPLIQIPQTLQSIVMRCLEKEPAARYQIVEDLLNDLTTFRDGGQIKISSNKVDSIHPTVWRRLAALATDATILGGVLTPIILQFRSNGHIALNPSVDWFHILMNLPVACLVLGFSWFISGVVTGSLLSTWILLGFTTILFSILSYDHLLLTSVLGILFVTYLYFAIFESSKYQATPGKLLWGIKVINADGKRLSFAHATWRCLAKAFSDPLFWLDYSLNVIPAKSKPFLERQFNMPKVLSSLFRHPPTDKWSNAYLINAKVLDNPCLPHLREYLRPEEKDLNIIYGKLEEIEAAIRRRSAVVLPIMSFLLLAVIFSPQPNEARLIGSLYLILSFVLVFTFCFVPYFSYYRTYTHIKNKLLLERKSKVDSIS